MNRASRWLASSALVLTGPALGQPLEPPALVADRGAAFGSNVPLGSDADVEAVKLDYDRSTGRLFAALRRASGDAHLLTSTDAGATWVDSLSFATAQQMDVVVQGGWLYVASAQGGVLTLRRISAATGLPDTTYNGTGTYPLTDVSPATIQEIALASNVTDANTAIYLFLLRSDHQITFLYGLDTSFSSVGTGWSGADSGLAAAWNIGMGGAPGAYYIFMSYISTADEVKVYRKSASAGVTSTVQAGATSAEETSLSVYRDRVVVGYEHPNGFGTDDAKYAISYDYGMDWGSGFAGTASSAAENFHAPLVSLASGTGMGVLVPRALGAVDDLATRERHNYAAPESWFAWSVVNDHAPRLLEPARQGFAFKWLGSGWGIGYIDGDGAAWFGWSSTIRYAGFESGNLSEWSP